MKKIAFIGGGSFGTSLAVLLAKKGNDISIFDRSMEVVNDININKRNSKYIKELIIPNNIKATNDIKEAIDKSNYVVLALPSHVIREAAKNLKNIIDPKVVIICIAKGIEEGTDKRLSVVLDEELDNPIVMLSGPSHAEEVSKGLATTIVVTSRNMEYANEVQDLFMTSSFRVYTNDDMVGVEIGGAVKNIIALAAGIGDGLGYGDNAKAALMTRGMKEISDIGLTLGGREKTFYGLTGMGDLIVTCTSMHSRNRRAGILIGQGKSVEDALKEVGMVVEGVKACKAFYELKEKLGISMPITSALYQVLFKNKDSREASIELMSRDKKSEN
jgi:glycerol-3-phosphate dehydrogenase (NAD(P)+)